jgi:hypothetical protein
MKWSHAGTVDQWHASHGGSEWRHSYPPTCPMPSTVPGDPKSKTKVRTNLLQGNNYKWGNEKVMKSAILPGMFSTRVQAQGEGWGPATSASAVCLEAASQAIQGTGQCTRCLMGCCHQLGRVSSQGRAPWFPCLAHCTCASSTWGRKKIHMKSQKQFQGAKVKSKSNKTNFYKTLTLWSLLDRTESTEN